MHGDEMYGLAKKLHPICRSITGNGVRDTLRIIKEIIPIDVYEVPTGTSVFDWTIPKEWNIRGGYIKNSKGETLLDFKNSNLHVLNYSVPIEKEVKFDELKQHLFTLPDHPDWIPYRTSYYSENWGFCMAHNQFLSLDPHDTYTVKIDSSLEPGSLTYGELLIPGEREDEILISTHICHPSLCNDNLSGIVVATSLANRLRKTSNRYSYRFIFIPATIGAITWLARNEQITSRIKGGFVLTLLGDKSKFTLKKTRQGDSETDKVAINVLRGSKKEFEIRDFSPYGYDERQFSSPGFNIPMVCFSRKPFGEFPEYHTSGDNLDFISEDKLEESHEILLGFFHTLEKNKFYINLKPKCEPQLGKYGLYSKFGGSNESKINQLACLWILNMSDGHNSLLDISDRSKIPFPTIVKMAEELLNAELLKEKPTT